jgi:hypothetical protein
MTTTAEAFNYILYETLSKFLYICCSTKLLLTLYFSMVKVYTITFISKNCKYFP